MTTTESLLFEPLESLHAPIDWNDFWAGYNTASTMAVFLIGLGWAVWNA